MNEDNLLLLFTFLVFWIILVILILLSKENKRLALLINLTVHLIYGPYFIHKLVCTYEGFSAAIWRFVILLFIMGTQLIINLIRLTILIIKKFLAKK